MAVVVLHSEKNEKGIELKITGDFEEMMKEIKKLTGYQLKEGASEGSYFKELVCLSACLDPEDDWKSIMDKIQRKKDGTFAKGRVSVLYRAESFTYEDEEAYCYKAPEIQTKVIDDSTVELRLVWGKQGW